MKKKKFTESQIVKILKEHDSGRDVVDLCREHGIHRSTIYNWKKKYGGLESMS
jgi:putative transposase